MIELGKGLGHQLEELKLLNSTAKNLTTIGLKKMLPFATKLSLFTLHSEAITIDLDDYRMILDAVKQRPEKQSLSIELSGKIGQVLVPKAILLENWNTLNIKEVVNESNEEDTYYDYSPDYERFDSPYRDPYDDVLSAYLNNPDDPYFQTIDYFQKEYI